MFNKQFIEHLNKVSSLFYEQLDFVSYTEMHENFIALLSYYVGRTYPFTELSYFGSEEWADYITTHEVEALYCRVVGGCIHFYTHNLRFEEPFSVEICEDYEINDVLGLHLYIDEDTRIRVGFSANTEVFADDNVLYSLVNRGLSGCWVTTQGGEKYLVIDALQIESLQFRLMQICGGDYNHE